VISAGQKDGSASRLAERLGELARAVGRSDVRSSEAERLLELAAMATVHAAALEVLLAVDRQEPPSAR